MNDFVATDFGVITQLRGLAELDTYFFPRAQRAFAGFAGDAAPIPGQDDSDRRSGFDARPDFGASAARAPRRGPLELNVAPASPFSLQRLNLIMWSLVVCGAGFTCVAFMTAFQD